MSVDLSDNSKSIISIFYHIESIWLGLHRQFLISETEKVWHRNQSLQETVEPLLGYSHEINLIGYS